MDFASVTWTTIWKRYASTVMDRLNFTILNLLNLSDPVLVTYKAEDFFNMYEFIFRADPDSPGISKSTQYSFLLTFASYYQSWTITQSNHLVILPRDFLATPMVVFSDVWMGRTLSDQDMGKSVSLAVVSYRVETTAEILADL